MGSIKYKILILLIKNLSVSFFCKGSVFSKNKKEKSDCKVDSSEKPSDQFKMTVDQINAIKKSNPGNIMAACFDETYFNSLNDDQKARLLKCCNSGIQNADSAMGCYAMNPDDYNEFEKFFKPVLEKYHKVDLSSKQHKNNWDLAGLEGLPSNGKLDVSEFGLAPLSMRIRTARNFKKFPLPGAMTKEDRVNMELAMGAVFDELIKNPDFGGEYVSLTPGHPKQMSEERYQELVKAHIMFKDMAADSYLVNAGIAGDWPYGRGCSKSDWAGVVTSCPTNIGTGMRASVHIQLPKLTADGTDTKAKAICDPFGLSVRGLGGEHTPIGADGTVDISPKARFCISEAEI